MATTKVTLEGMRSALSAMQQTVDSSKQNLNGVEGSIETLTSSWTGASAGQFRTALTSWEQDCNQILTTMTGLIESMQAASNTYQQTEQVNTDSAAQLQSAFGAMSL